MSDIIHTIKFKLHNVKIDVPRIDLADDAWIEIDPTMPQEMPRHFAGFLSSSMAENPQWGLIRWFQELFNSDVVIGTTHSAEQNEIDPFESTECSYIAIALSILVDSWFVAGIAYHKANDGQNHPQPASPYTTTFNGDGSRKVLITEHDIPTLKTIYDFVYSAFRTSTRDERKRKLIALYSQCLVRTSPQATTALTWRFSTPFGGQTGTIVHTSIFFEHVFTSTGWMSDVEDGIKKHWNTHFPKTQITWEDVKVLQKYRSMLIHDNPTGAKEYMDNWQKKHNVPDDELLKTLERKAIKIVKQIMRTIALNYDDYLKYRQSLP